MELLISIVVLGYLAYRSINLLRWKARKTVHTIDRLKPRSKPYHPVERVELDLGEHTTSPDSGTPDPFDASTAEDRTEKKTIVGPAYVIDGDSIVIQKTQVRIFGIDAPEINHPYGQKAKWAMVSLCKGRTVCAEILAEDDHGRTVARCTLPDGRDLSAEMVKQGLALDWPKFSNGEFRHLETPDARKKLWLADARQKGQMNVWKRFEEKQAARAQET